MREEKGPFVLPLQKPGSVLYVSSPRTDWTCSLRERDDGREERDAKRLQRDIKNPTNQGGESSPPLTAPKTTQLKEKTVIGCCPWQGGPGCLLQSQCGNTKVPKPCTRREGQRVAGSKASEEPSVLWRRNSVP